MEKRKVMMDTSAYAAFLRGSPGVKEAVQQADEIVFNPVVLGELIAGFLMGRNEKRNRAILKDFLSSPRVIIAEIDEETSERYAVIVHSLRMRGTPIPTNDLWIAASAMQHGLEVLTTDKHYLEVPQIITEYFEPG
ncbi:MAG: type II toxin-antitoxin system VapC family toxin [Desulfobacterales bacterium]|jgi:tRNA(fMet)-specific endonuclease VapC|nr:type II toxin-antitoxin system VapC family toxin [Desulfobacterales bacterium]